MEFRQDVASLLFHYTVINLREFLLAMVDDNSISLSGLFYRIVQIPKGLGEFRKIYIASPDCNKILRGFLPELERVLAEVDDFKLNFAFERDKNCALHALQHIGGRYVLSIDLKDFFDSVVPAHVCDVIPDYIINQCFIDGNPKQGLPTSPLIATIAFLKCDKKIIHMLNKLDISAVYTRYADDLVFSFNERRYAGQICTIVRQIVENQGFKINERKTTLQDAKNGRVIVTGIAIDPKGLYPTRRTKKKIRAAIHQENSSSLRGLLDWSKCKLPNSIYACEEKLDK